MTITHRSQSTTSTQRDSWVEINLSALERNFLKLKDLTKTNIMAVVKADAYGHGATATAPILQSLGVHSFGVATIDEGIALRNAGIKTPILMLGATPFWSYDQCLKNDLTITLYSKDQITLLENFSKDLKSKIPVQIKIDTGMNRLGIDYKEGKEVIDSILNSSCFKLEGIFSHLSSAHDVDFSNLQKERFDSAVGAYKDIPKHIANSYAAINYPDFRYDLVRVGVAIFGQEYNFLEPIISVKGRITEIHKIYKDDYVSYNRTWQAKKDSLIATIPIGYADGVDKKLSNKLKAIYNDSLIDQVGNITMDQMMFDISDIKDGKVNDVITLIGKENEKEIAISDWAKELDTITWELICRLKIRLPRIYTRD
jgi:alanine racemase